MRNAIRRHIPTFVDVDERPGAEEFDTLDDLVKIPWIAKRSERADFQGFCHSDNCLMATYRGGREWWVLGYLRAPVDGLPAWGGGLYEAIDENGAAIDIPASEVASSNSFAVTLRDGRTLRSGRASASEEDVSGEWSNGVMTTTRRKFVDGKLVTTREVEPKVEQSR